MTFNIWTFLFEVLNFLVLAVILYRLLYRPLREAVERRKEENDHAKAEAEAARKEADDARQQLAAKLAEADRDRLVMLRAAAEQADIEKAKRLAEADSAARAIREQAQRDAERLRQDTITSVEAELGEQAVGLAQRLLTQACDASLSMQLTHRLVEAIRAIPAAEREQVRRDAGSSEAVVECATSLDEPTSLELAAAVHELLGHQCAIRNEVKPALVGGARLQVGGHVWDSSVAGQLDAARSALHEGA